MFRINKCAKITDTQGCQSALSARNSSLLSLHISNNALARWLGKLIKCATHFSDAINSDFSRKQLCCAIFSIAEFLPLGQKYKAEFGIKSLS